MKLGFKILYLKKRFPLAISRGVRYGNHNLFVSVEKDGIVGWGEMAPGKTEGADTAEEGKAFLTKFFTPAVGGLSISEIFELGKKHGVPSCAMAALDIALWDWKAKTAGKPLYQLLGFQKGSVPTSITIGINTPKVVGERIPLLMQNKSIKALKIKLGSPEGLKADQAMFSQVIKSSEPYNLKIRVDANGGWNLKEAKYMLRWLADLGVDYVEQPMAEGREDEFLSLYNDRPIPIFLDESCRKAEDVVKVASFCDGVNMKLMKCGGITGALKIISKANSFGLKTMIGCMGESSLSIAAAAALSGALTHIDLDSHLNLEPDPCSGAPLIDGIITPLEIPGHGAQINLI